MHATTRGGARARRGSVVVVIAIAVAALGTLSLAILSSVGSSYGVTRQVREEAGAMYVAEAGLTEAVYELSQGGDGVLGTDAARRRYGDGQYWVQVEVLGTGVLSLVSTAVEGRTAARVQLVVRVGPQSLFSWAAFGDEGMALASNAHVDSYDSGAGSYDDQAVNGSGSDTYASQNGNIGSNLDITVKQNAVVNGNASPGPDGTVVVSGANAEVSGSTAPASGKQDMPEIEVPVIPSAGPLTVSGTVTLPAGDHAFDALLVDTGGLFAVTGPARIVLQSAELSSNSEIRVDATAGPVEFFVLDDFLMNSNTLIASTTRTPADIELNLLSDNVINPDAEIDLDDVDFESNAKLFGTVYAPHAAIEINSNFELFGSLVARSVVLDSWSRIHFDEALLDAGGGEEEKPTYERICWRELPVAAKEIAW